MHCVREAFGLARIWLNGSLHKGFPCLVGVTISAVEFRNGSSIWPERVGVLVRQVDVGGMSEAGSTDGERRVSEAPGPAGGHPPERLGMARQRQSGGSVWETGSGPSELPVPHQRSISACRATGPRIKVPRSENSGQSE